MSHGVMSRSYLWCPCWYVLAVVSLLFIVQEQLWRTERSAEDGSWAFAGVLASEFPERECCDPVYPPPVPTAPSSSAATPTGRSGPNIKTAIAILNCLLARQLCFEDVSCSAILEIIPRVCGPELVACSTVTVTKCQAALRTLQAFPFFKPTCLCREPHVDPECNSFRDFLFDHPCVFVHKKEKDPYPVDALPTCNHALSVCQQEQKCIKLFEDFKTNCKVRDNKCRMDDRELCHESWTNLRLSPMFGCICPNNHMKRRCDRIFSIVNHNPCVDILPVSLDLSGTDSALYPYNPENGYFKNFWFPPTNHYPYFLYPPTSRPRSSYHPIAIATNNIISPSPSQSLSIHHYSQHQLPPAHGIYTYRTNKHLKHKQGLSSTGTFTATDVNDINRLTIEETLNTPLEYDEPPGDIVVTVTRLSGVHSTTDVKVISSSENASTTLDYGLDIELQLENPLVDSSGGEGHGHGHMHGHAHKGGFLDLDRGSNATAYNEEGLHHGHKKTHSSPSDTMRIDNELAKIAFQSTCHLALENCNKNISCRNALEPVLNHCDMTRCDRNSCMDALQNLYRKPELSWSLEIAFCLCKKTDNKQDACLVAQEKLHPICAQRVEGLPLPTCHSLAEICRREKECRGRLEYYEQSCAVDSVTKKCAGPASECRTAMLGILGTELRTTCACKGTDFTQLYDCLGWQRLLWVNPCVVESQKDFHIKRAALQMTTTSTTLPTMKTTMQTPARKPRPDIRPDIPVPDPVTVMTITEPVTEVKITTTTEFVPKPIPTTTTTTTTTQEPRFCVVQRPSQSDQKILEGSSKRLYHEDELECSELCQCGRGVSGVNLVCHTICVDQIPCKTDFAVYHHAAPAYQAYRGRCLCYSGQFICMRPTPGEYSLPQGVFLFLGYSERDEELLKPHSNMTVQDAVASLQEFMVHEVDNQTSCQLYLFNVTKSNVILVAKLADENNIDADEGTVLLKEQKECAVILETISEKINSQHPEFNSHLLLSIFKIAEVEIVKAELNSCPNLILTSSLFPILPISFLTWLIQKYHYSKIVVHL